MYKVFRLIGQVVFYGIFIAVIGFLSVNPSYTHLRHDQAVIKLTLNHGGKIVGDCRKPTVEEIEGYPRNLVPPEICPRERSPVRLSMMVDGVTLYKAVLPPSGLRKDGSATAYRRINLAAGAHDLVIEMNDNVKVTGATHRHKVAVKLAPAQVLVVNFDTAQDKFVVK